MPAPGHYWVYINNEPITCQHPATTGCILTVHLSHPSTRPLLGVYIQCTFPIPAPGHCWVHINNEPLCLFYMSCLVQKSTRKKPAVKTPGKSSKKSKAGPVPDDNDDPESKPYHCERKGDTHTLAHYRMTCCHSMHAITWLAHAHTSLATWQLLSRF